MAVRQYPKFYVNATLHSPLISPASQAKAQMYVLLTLRNKRDFNHTIIELSRLDKTFKIIESSQVCDCCLWTPKLLVL